MKKLITILLVCISSILHAQNPTFKYASAIGGYWNLHNTGIAVDAKKNTYISGYFYGTVDFDPGAGVYNLTSNGSYDACLYKLDSLGKFVWAKQIGSTADDRALSIAIDAAANVYTTGYYAGPVDFDPGIGTDIQPSYLYVPNIYVLKLDSAGNHSWAKVFLGNGSGSGDFAQGAAIALDAANNVYTAGFFQGTFDFNPDATATFSIATNGGKDAYISKLSASGNFVWAKRIGNSDYNVITAIAVDTAANVYTKGYYYGLVDMDPGAGVTNVAYAYPNTCAVTKLNSAGDFVYTKQLAGDNNGNPHTIAIDKAGNFFHAGMFHNVTDFNPDAAVFNLTPNSTSYSDIFITKFDKNGNFLWAKKYGDAYNDQANAITIDNNDNLLITGYGYYQTGIFVSRLTNDGAEYWTSVLNGTGGANGNGYALTTDNLNNVYVTGDFKQTVDFDPGSNTYNITGTGAATDATEYVLKLNYNCTKPSGGLFLVTNDSVCAGDTAIIQASASVGAVYQWYKGAALLSGQNSLQLLVTQTGIYKVQLTSGSGCSKTYTSPKIKMVALPAATITAAGPTTFCAGQHVVLNANLSPALSYQWKKGANLINGATNVSYTASLASTYKCIVTNSFGCSKISNGIKVTVNCREAVEIEKQNRLYPNPINGGEILNLDFSSATNQNTQLHIFDTKGTLIQTANLAVTEGLNQIQINTAALKAGLYMIQMNAGNENVRQTFMVQ